MSSEAGQYLLMGGAARQNLLNPLGPCLPLGDVKDGGPVVQKPKPNRRIAAFNVEENHLKFPKTPLTSSRGGPLRLVSRNVLEDVPCQGGVQAPKYSNGSVT